MSVFIQKLNPMTGINDWIVQHEDYDFHQEVARAAFADMLHDTERNAKYESALKMAIESMHANGKPAKVLDIGTGTGLLSMMAVRHGADSVTACEAFRPMSECAMKIIKRNGFEQKIKVIPKRSTDLTVGESGDLPERCNILVTEVFDTELIGEGALSTFQHAHQVLLEQDSIVIPHSATIYAQLVECPLVQNWNKIKDVYGNEGKILVEVNDRVRNCNGSASVHDLQLSQLDLQCFNTILAPQEVFHFDWSGKTPLVFDRTTVISKKAQRAGVAQAVFMWWDLQMDTRGDILLSCAPYWAHPMKTRDIPWRDHWMQAVYYLPKEIKVQEDQEISLLSSHDEFSLWFELSERREELQPERPICECGMHAIFSRTRLGQINDSTRNKKFLRILERYVNAQSVILVLSDGFYLSLAAAKMGAKKIYYVETNHVSKHILYEFVKHNDLQHKVEIFDNVEALQARKDINDINLVLGEPYFLHSILPWDHLMFIYLLKGVRNHLTNDAKVFPKVARIRGVAVKFKDLNKIRLPLGDCQGFSMKEFDDLIEASSNISDNNVEAQPLWEYPGVALSQITNILEIDCVNVPEKVLEARGAFDIAKSQGGCNGIALWVDWVHDHDTIVSSGPVGGVEIGQKINWDVHTRQGVCLFPDKNDSFISFEFKFDFNEGNICFSCK